MGRRKKAEVEALAQYSPSIRIARALQTCIVLRQPWRSEGDGDGVYGTNSDGAELYGPLLLSGNTLYGTACVGGTNGDGPIFAVNTDGSNFKTLYNFSSGTGSAASVPSFYTNSDGANPVCGLVLSGNTLYGVASNGGTNGLGTIFAITTDGTAFKGPLCFLGRICHNILY